MNALIIVDVQNDFLPGGNLEVPNSGHIIEVINRLQLQFELVVATQDWHPRNHISFATNHPDKLPFDNIMIGGMEQTLWPNHCVQNSSGADFPNTLHTEKIEAIFRKGTNPDMDSYSAFFDNGHFKRTGLAGYLVDKDINHLYFCGLAADLCVYFSIVDAINEDFICTLIVDATYPLNKHQFENVLNDLSKRGVNIVESQEINFNNLHEVQPPPVHFS